MVARRLSERWRRTEFKVRLGGNNVPEIRVFWTDGPRPLRVRHVVARTMQEDIDKTAFAVVEPPSGVTYHHRFSRPLRLAVRDLARIYHEDFDYITENGDFNPDSQYAQDVCELNYAGSTDQDEGAWIHADNVDRFVQLLAYHLQALVQGPDPDGVWIR